MSLDRVRSEGPAAPGVETSPPRSISRTERPSTVSLPRMVSQVEVETPEIAPPEAEVEVVPPEPEAAPVGAKVAGRGAARPARASAKAAESPPAAAAV